MERPVALLPRRSSVRWPVAIASILVATGSMAAPVDAAPIVTGIHRTGLVAAPSPFRRSLASDGDPYWRVVALPETPAFPSYEAALFSGREPSFHVPATWFHGADGFDGAGWIGLRPETTDSLYPPNVGAQPDYTVIYATTFTASDAGSALFDLTGTADNELSFFVNGAVTGSLTMTPSILGGTQIGLPQGHLNSLHEFVGLADVLAGENTLYAVVRDRYVLNPTTNIGGYGQTGLLVSSVPEPGTLVSGMLGAASLVIGRACRRRPRAGRGASEGNCRPEWGKAVDGHGPCVAWPVRRPIDTRVDARIVLDWWGSGRHDEACEVRRWTGTTGGSRRCSKSLPISGGGSVSGRGSLPG